MTFVDMKKLDTRVEDRIMILINRTDAGMNLQSVKYYFRIPYGMQQAILEAYIPGWTSLSRRKQKNRVNKMIWRLIKGGRARVQKDLGMEPRLIPLNILDKIVFALDRDDDAESP